MVRTIGLDHLYVKIRKLILLARGYTELEHLDYLIKMCRLKPYDTVFGKTERIKLHRQWIDEFGHSLNICKNKKLQIDFDDLTIDRARLVSTDLYEGLSIHKLYMMSKLAFFLTGKIGQKEHGVIALLGIDDYLRTFVFIEGTWTLCSPLRLGLRVLRHIATNTNLENFREWKPKESVIHPCDVQQAWLTCVPVTEEFERVLSNNNLALILDQIHGEE